MEKAKAFLGKSRVTDLALLLCSFAIYFVYFHNVLLRPNSQLSSITGDALKNYFTFSYHIQNDESSLHFSGMNHPFGEHVVFTDCQPILTFLLRLLPFTHGHLIGILHYLLLGSYIISPLILLRICRRIGIAEFPAFFMSLAITLLAPQFARINGGHHALAYGCFIPYAILLLLNYQREPRWKSAAWLFLYNLLLFFLHPYVGFSSSLFCFAAVFVFHLYGFQWKNVSKGSLLALLTGLLPIVAFRLFMKLSDRHPGRTEVPHGNRTLVENLDTLMAPDFGPFRAFMESIFTHKTPHIEGHSYLGFFTILLTLGSLILAAFFLKKIRLRKDIAAIFISSLLLLFISFGWQNAILDLLHLENSSFNQFRATTRFAWFFYYVLPLFLVSSLYFSFEQRSTHITFRRIASSLAVVFLLLNLWEAHFYFKKDHAHFWKFRNILNARFLTQEEKALIKDIRQRNMQAILPLPVYSFGSEIYDRNGADYSMIPAMMYAYHTGLPVISGAMSRTSIPETEKMIGLLNSYKKKNEGVALLNEKPILVIKTTDPLMADEDRLLTAVSLFHHNDSLQFGEIRKEQLLVKKLDTEKIYIQAKEQVRSQQLIFIPYEHRKPFLPARMQDFEQFFTLDSNTFESGTYILSFHHHYTKKLYTSFDLLLILNKLNSKEAAWEQLRRVSALSGFYPGFGVMEYKIQLDKKSKYEFLFNGIGETEYHISNFMIRKEHVSVISINGKDTLYNNFPD